MRGAALAITLMSLFLMLTLLAMAFGATSMTQRVEERYWRALNAEQAARAGLAIALQNVQSDTTFHGDVSGQLATAGGAWRVTFVRSNGPFSTNNLQGAGAVVGYQGRRVPAGCCHVVSTGAWLNATGTAEVMVRPKGDGLQVLSRWGE